MDQSAATQPRNVQDAADMAALTVRREKKPARRRGAKRRAAWLRTRAPSTTKPQRFAPTALRLAPSKRRERHRAAHGGERRAVAERSRHHALQRVKVLLIGAAQLQVDAANVPARAVYRRLGFVDAYNYHYRSPEVEFDTH